METNNNKYIIHNKLGKLYHGDKLKVKITRYKATTLFEATLYIQENGCPYLLQNKIEGSTPSAGTGKYKCGWVICKWDGETDEFGEVYISDIYDRAEDRLDPFGFDSGYIPAFDDHKIREQLSGLPFGQPIAGHAPFYYTTPVPEPRISSTHFQEPIILRKRKRLLKVNQYI